MLSHVTIFANGELPLESISIPSSSTVIAADGGASHCLKLGINPDVVIGDFDSLSHEEIDVLKENVVVFIKFPIDKNKTDLELALDHTIELGAEEVSLYGLFGGRWDMTFANILLLASSRFSGLNIRLISGENTAYIVRSGETITFQGQVGTIVSVMPLNGQGIGITYEGLQWSLDDATLSFGSSRGVSNRMTGTKARISLLEGTLLVFTTDK